MTKNRPLIGICPKSYKKKKNSKYFRSWNEEKARRRKLRENK